MHCAIELAGCICFKEVPSSLDRFYMAEMNMADTKVTSRARPLSPHLMIYRLTLTFVMSGMHRITGFFLYAGTVLLVWWLLAAATGPNAYAWFTWAAKSWIGLLVLLGYTFTLIHHSLGGIRHLIWDLAHGFEPRERELLGLVTIAGSVSLTVLLWIAALVMMGGLP
jgi:succinate dehydrogenase / fumarate reductase, cytochrome b subunit